MSNLLVWGVMLIIALMRRGDMAFLGNTSERLTDFFKGRPDQPLKKRVWLNRVTIIIPLVMFILNGFGYVAAWNVR